MAPFTRRWLRGLGIALAVAAAYGLGVLTGVVGSAVPEPAPAAASPGVLDEAARRIQQQAVREVDPEVLHRAAVEGMLGALGDRWSQYFSPAEYGSFRDALEGRYTGIGVWLRESDLGGVEVSSVQRDSEADAVGLRAEDRLLAIDGDDATALTLSTAAALLRGEPGSTVQLRIERLSGASATRLTLQVPRAAAASPDVTLERLEGDIDLIRIAAFSRGVGKQVRDAVSDVDAGRGGVVLDLRGNPGGLLTEAVEVASVFLDGGPVVSYGRRDQPETTLDAVGVGNVDVPVVVLVDGDTASAAEVVAAALQDRNRAVVIGSRTYGKGSIQEPQQLPDGTAIEFTVGMYRTPSGRAIDGVGVDPDIAVAEGSSPGAAEGRALEVLRGLLAALGDRG